MLSLEMIFGGQSLLFWQCLKAVFSGSAERLASLSRVSITSPFSSCPSANLFVCLFSCISEAWKSSLQRWCSKTLPGPKQAKNLETAVTARVSGWKSSVLGCAPFGRYCRSPCFASGKNSDVHCNSTQRHGGRGSSHTTLSSTEKLISIQKHFGRITCICQPC